MSKRNVSVLVKKSYDYAYEVWVDDTPENVEYMSRLDGVSKVGKSECYKNKFYVSLDERYEPESVVDAIKKYFGE
jgi:hypothetical protein